MEEGYIDEKRNPVLGLKWMREPKVKLVRLKTRRMVKKQQHILTKMEVMLLLRMNQV